LNEIYIKLELDAEAAERVRKQESHFARIGIQAPVDAAGQPLPLGEEAKGNLELLPGERPRVAAQHDDILLACAPYPSNKAQAVLPRYLTRVRQVDCQAEGCNLIDQTYSSYYGGVQFRIRGAMAEQRVIWLKPEFNCPQGQTIWVASQVRKVSFVLELTT